KVPSFKAFGVKRIKIIDTGYLHGGVFQQVFAKVASDKTSAPCNQIMLHSREDLIVFLAGEDTNNLVGSPKRTVLTFPLPSTGRSRHRCLCPGCGGSGH